MTRPEHYGETEPAYVPSDMRKGDCNATDGWSVCVLAPGHGHVHWDSRTQHEWDDEAEGDQQ